MYYLTVMIQHTVLIYVTLAEWHNIHEPFVVTFRQQFNQNRFVAFTLNGAGAIVNPGRGTSDGSGSPSGTLNQNS
jgi:hypothetical protein